MDAKEIGNQPAYPVPPGCSFRDGLTKREAFAMAAMQGFAASTGYPDARFSMAAHAVKWADALLAELAKAE